MTRKRTRTAVGAAGALALALVIVVPGGVRAAGPQVSFAAAVALPTGGTDPIAAVAGDFDGDSVTDLATAHYSTLDASLLTGKGDGTFAAAATTRTGGTGPEGAAAADFDNDGTADLAVGDVSGTVSVFLGTAGGLGTPVSVPGGGSAVVAVATGDVTGDSRTDIVAANFLSGTVAVLAGRGDGTFAPAVTYPAGYLGSRPVAVAVGDVNADGRADVAVAASSSGGGTVRVLLGTTTGALQPRTVVSSGGSHPVGLAMADVNADGRADVVVTNTALAGTLAVLLSDGTGAFTSLTTFATGGSLPRGVAVADLDRDGRPDLAVANGGTGIVGVLAGDGAGAFGAAATFPTGGTTPLAVAAADLNGDSVPDLAVANAGSGTIGVLVNTTAALAAPVFTSADNAAAPAKAPFSFTVTTTGTPTPAITAAGLPRWLTLTDNGDGTATLAGTPKKGTSTFTLTAANGVGPAAVQAFTLTVR